MTLLEKKYLLKDGSINYAVLRNEVEPLRELEFSFENFKADFPNELQNFLIAWQRKAGLIICCVLYFKDNENE